MINGLPSAFQAPDGSTHDLRVVPGGILDPTDPDREAKRLAWRKWRRLVQRYRLTRLQECATDPAQQAVELEKCRRYGPAYFITTWGWVIDPRLDDDGRPRGESSFILYPFQVEFLHWLDQRLVTPGALGDGLVSKARDMGATWLCCMWSLHGWLFRESFRARFVSRNKDAVDRTNDPDTIFAKIDFAFQHLPAWMRPAGYNPDDHRMDMRLKHPLNGNVLSGESTTTKSMRGARATVAIYDEAAFIPNFLGVWTTGAHATHHRIAVSTESMEEGDDWINLRQGKGQAIRAAVLELDWWMHTEHDDAWYQREKERSMADPEGFAREVERNAHAGYGAYIYEASHAMSVLPGLGWEQGMAVYVGIDPGFDDDCAIVALGWDAYTGRYRAIDAYANRLQIPEFYAALLLGYVPEDAQASGPYDPVEFAALMRRIGSFQLFGDPAGTSRVTGKRDSWYERMNDWAFEKHGRDLPVIVGWDPDQRIFSGRRQALMKLLPRLDFNDTPGSRALLRSLQDHRFENHSRARLSEQIKPLHNANSHPVAALEYIAVNLEQLTAVSVALPGPYATAETGAYATS